jgi:OOP family OmpA-OmpF porin
MSNRGLTALFGLGLSALAPSAASAQEAVPYDPAIDLNLFEYAIGPKTFFTVADATVSARKQLAVDFLVTYFTHPFTVYNVDDDNDVITTQRVDVVSSAMIGDLSASYGLTDKFQLGVALPIVFQMAGDGLMPTTAQPTADGFKATGTGDLRAELKTKLWRKNTLELAGAVGATLPSSFGSGEGAFIGDDLPSLRGRAILQWSNADGKLVLGANAGFAFRKPRTIYASTIGQQLVWGVAAAYRPTDKFSLVAESFGRTGLEGFDLDASPLEAGGGARVIATKAVAVTIGGSAGVVRGIGSPDFRVFASVGWAPDTRDTDGDGIPNNKDRCPVAAEDKDSWEDRDGCPDDDNDGDRRDDATDKCPDEPEDFDGFEDDDGCPEADNDGDGFADLEDTCKLDKEDGKDPFPKDGCPWDKRDTDVDGVMDNLDQCAADPEDADGFEDWDGCPDFDQDKDGVADEDDQCPVCAEDKDGFADEDGCPELDNDNDGLADAVDKCPGEAEYLNGVDDFDGCPDEGGAVIAELDGDRLNLRAPPSFDKKGLNKGGKIIVDQVALTMLQNPLVSKWLVAVSAKKKKDADQRAGWIKDHLASRGVDVSKLQIVTSAGADQIGFVVQERADAPAGGVCPAGMEVTPRPAPEAPAVSEPATPAPAPAPAPVPAPAPAPPPAPPPAPTPATGGVDDLK